uniref:S-formylglutathione hydrolase n=1 Tax=Chinchilla lanigera TaxID=34839 RepID=A0A8C2V160_CHILA
MVTILMSLIFTDRRMALKQISSNKCFGGLQKVFEHESVELKCKMKFAVYLPPKAETGKCPALYWLSGLTCTEQNFISKSGYHQAASEHGLVVIFLWQVRNFKQGASDCIWFSKIELTYNFFFFLKSVSAFAPICNPVLCPWGKKAFTGYLGTDQSKWKTYDATHLVKSYPGSQLDILIDQGKDDQFLSDGQLLPDNFIAACTEKKIPVVFRLQEGYDHSYYFIATFIADHIRHHAKYLNA